MRKDNPLYKEQGIHVITAIFTVEKGNTKVLLIRRKNEPYKDMWALVGGALYNNEELEIGAKREIYEKTGIDNINIYFSGIFSKVDRSPVMRMVAVSYIGIIDFDKVSVLKETLNTVDAAWFDISEVPELAYDHNDILNTGVNSLKEKIHNSDILRSLFPNGFTIPEIQKTYETILNHKLDRRNFRKKILSNNLIEDTNKEIRFDGVKPAKLYKFRK